MRTRQKGHYKQIRAGCHGGIFRDRLHVYFIENKQEADRIADQVLVNKRSRESAEKARLNIKKS